MKRKNIRKILFKVIDLSGLAILLTAAFFLSFKAGERGFFALDQAMYFDGAYRIVCGQIPFKDFFMVCGPMTFWLHAIPFKIFGVNYFAYLFGAAFVNVMAAIAAVVILRLFFPKRIFLSYLGGILTAICFYPPAGTPFYEHTAMIFSLFAILLTTSALISKDIGSNRTKLFLFIAGVLMTAAFLSKQNIIFLFPVFFLLIWAADMEHKWRSIQRVIAFLCGIVGSMAMFIWWIWKRSDFQAFFYSFFSLASKLGSYRVTDCFKKFIALKGVGSGDLRNAMHIALMASILAIFFYYIRARNIRYIWKRNFLAGILCLYGIFFQYVFICTTNNEVEMASLLAGIIFALGAGLLYEVMDSVVFVSKPNRRFFICKVFGKAVIISVILAGAYGFAKEEIWVAFTRSTQQFGGGTRFSNYMPIEKLKNLKWGQPTLLNNIEIKESDFVGVYEYLKAKDQNFFVFPDYTIFYGLLNKPSPQPLLWFFKGETYPEQYNPAIDQKIVNALQRNNVQIIIIESVFFLNCTTIEDFPLLKKYITDNFLEKTRIGIFLIYEKDVYKEISRPIGLEIKKIL